MISIIIPTHNGLENLKMCYSHILKQSYKDFNLIVVDNGSTDGSLDYFLKNYSEVIFLKLEKNFGFAKATNTGVKYAIENHHPDIILLLNNDIEIPENFLEKGAGTFESVKEASFVAVKMLNYFKRDIIDDAGDFIKSNGGSPLARGHGEKDEGQYDKAEFIFGACAGAAFYKSELFIKCGFFDEDFISYLEDVDLSFRFQLAGYKCYYNPELVCYHKRGETIKQFKGMEAYYSEKNLVNLRLKNYPLSIYIKYTPLFFAARLRRYYIIFRTYPFGIFISAIKGYFKGLTQLPKSYKKRSGIQKIKTVSLKYIESLFK